MFVKGAISHVARPLLLDVGTGSEQEYPVGAGIGQGFPQVLLHEMELFTSALNSFPQNVLEILIFA